SPARSPVIAFQWAALSAPPPRSRTIGTSNRGEMRIRNAVLTAALAALVIALPAQQPASSPPGGGRGGRAGGFVPGQQRKAEDPAQVERGKALYSIHCTGCHGADLRGGDIGGPNLLRYQLALSDKEGELIAPIIQGSRQSAGMPAIPVSPDD